MSASFLINGSSSTMTLFGAITNGSNNGFFGVGVDLSSPAGLLSGFVSFAVVMTFLDAINNLFNSGHDDLVTDVFIVFLWLVLFAILVIMVLVCVMGAFAWYYFLCRIAAVA